MYCFYNRDNLCGVLCGNRHFSALGELVVKLLVERGSTNGEGVADKFTLLGMLDKVLAAVCGIAIIVLKRRFYNRALGILTVYDISPLLQSMR